ncbi:MAG: 5-formyltetrahydrofolate cyclo-ligase [Rhizobiales bacterium 65-9]|nr:5-formyltetrahydrofolate cyclo-ligase [Hyphomicrobiales bacterium]OJY38608.1 MAG: 5-formyltetrahydrofolate cyclo-ligase [Rhizobiales bacterium 65-9]
MAKTPTPPAGEAHDYSSPPCFMHEIDPAYSGLSIDPQQWKDVARWRKAERERMIAARLAMSAEVRRRFTEEIARRLDALLGEIHGRTVSLYWPFRGEPDLRDWMETVWRRGGVCALPVVERKAAPLTFRSWRSGEPLEKGVWNIPFPANGRAVRPDVVIAPVVGFDRGCYRLGYGGGFFDRTLASLSPKPIAIGVGYGAQETPSIYPQNHDVPMRAILTENETISAS